MRTHSRMAVMSTHTPMCHFSGVRQTPAYLLLGMLLLDKLRVGGLQLAVQPGVFVCSWLPRHVLRDTVPQQTLREGETCSSSNVRNIPIRKPSLICESKKILHELKRGKWISRM